MPPRPRPWFRFYSEAVDSLKVHELPDRLAKPWLFMLCLASENTPRGSLPPLQRIAFRLRVKEERAQSILDDLVNRGFIDRAGDGYVMHQWDDWQKDRDVSPSMREGSRDLPTDVNHANRDDSATKIALEKRREEERVEKEKDTEREQTPARSVTFVQHNNPPFPDEAGFAGEYARRYELRVGKHPGASQVSDALQLARDFGEEACVQAAEDTRWEKPPSWLRHKLEDRKNAAVWPGTTPVADPSYAGIRSKYDSA